MLAEKPISTAKPALNLFFTISFLKDADQAVPQNDFTIQKESLQAFTPQAFLYIHF